MWESRRFRWEESPDNPANYPDGDGDYFDPPPTPGWEGIEGESRESSVAWSNIEFI
jgi:hypothetical protein